MIENARLHHVGCLVADLKTAMKEHHSLWLNAQVSEVYDVKEQQVKVCFLRTHPDEAAVEIVEPAGGSSLHALLRRGISLYHLAYEVPDFDAALKQAQAAGARCMKPFVSEAFGGRRCVFMYTSSGQLIELIEAALCN